MHQKKQLEEKKQQLEGIHQQLEEKEHQLEEKDLKLEKQDQQLQQQAEEHKAEQELYAMLGREGRTAELLQAVQNESYRKTLLEEFKNTLNASQLQA